MTRSAVVVGIGTVAERLAQEITDRPGWILRMLVSSTGGTPRMEMLARKLGVPYRAAKDVNNRALVEEVLDIAPHFIFSADTHQRLGSALLAAARVGSVNFHNGPLPAYRGLNIPSWVIWNEEKTHAISWHWMLDKLDAGATIIAPAVEVHAADTALSLTLKCLQAAVDSLPELLTALGTHPPSCQDHSQGGRYYRRNDVPNDGIIDVSWPAQKILRLYRALRYGPIREGGSTVRLCLEGRDEVVKSIRLLKGETRPPLRTGQELLYCHDGVLLITMDQRL